MPYIEDPAGNSHWVEPAAMAAANPTAPGMSQQAAFDQWMSNPNQWGGSLSPDLVNGISNYGWMTAPNADLSGSAPAQFVRDPSTGNIMWHPQGQGPGENYYLYDPSGKFLKTQVGSKTMSPAQGVLAVGGSALGMNALFGGLGALGTTGTATGGWAGGGGAGVGAGSAGGFGGAGAVTGLPEGSALDAAYGGLDGGATLGGGTAGAGAATAGAGAAGGGGSSFLDSIKSGASNLFGSGTGGGFNWGSLVGPAASLVGGYMNSNAAKTAAQTQADAADKAAQLSEPWRQAGMSALTRMQELLGVGGNAGAPDYGSLAKPFTFTNDDPSYQFRFNQGQKAVQNSYAGKGAYLSGAAGKALVNYGQDAASQEYGAAFNRDQATKTNNFNRLASLAGNGQTAANTIGEYGTQGANARAAGTVGGANAMNNALTGAWNSYTSNELLNKLLQR